VRSMAAARRHRIKDVAQAAGVSVRTLHHYDEIGLLVPSGRSHAGYRWYSDDDLLRLQQIVIGRELGLSLEDIRRSLDEPGFDRRRALVEQRSTLERRARQTEAMLRAIDAAIAVIDADSQPLGDTMDMKQIFDGFDPSKYEAETKQRWGNTDAYKESQARTRRYSREDWQRFADEQAGIHADAFRALQQGKAADDEAVMDVAERHRLAIDRWFYPCGHALHRALADMYEQDPRFADNIDKFGAGLTPYLSAAMRANARRNGA
jgi:DNA-binding transcriptional MerR regulator